MQYYLFNYRGINLHYPTMNIDTEPGRSPGCMEHTCLRSLSVSVVYSEVTFINFWYNYLVRLENYA